MRSRIELDLRRFVNIVDAVVIANERVASVETSRDLRESVTPCPMRPTRDASALVITAAARSVRHRLEMKHAAWLAIALGTISFLSGCSKEPGEGFEGEIDMTETATGLATPATIRYFIKGERVRVETTAATMTMTSIVDISTNDLFILDDAKRSYRAIRGKPAPTPATATATLPTASLFHRSSSKSAVVAGVPCAIKSTTLPTGHVETCACDGLNLPSRAWSNLFGADPSGAFVLRREMFDTTGTRVASIETNHIERTTESSTLFEVPSGYMLVK